MKGVLMNVNFYNQRFFLYINGILCAKRSFVILSRGQPTSEECCYRQPICAEARDMLGSIFGIFYGETWFKHKPYYYTDWMSYMLADGERKLFSGNMLFEEAIEEIVLKTEYERQPDVSMNKLMWYSADLVIDYLKERGITSCPLKAE